MSYPICRKGHPYTPENTQRLPNGARVCKICRSRRGREYRERVRGGLTTVVRDLGEINAEFGSKYQTVWNRYFGRAS